MEMYIDDGITIDEIDAVSGTLTVGKINSIIDGTNTRSIIHFTKYSLSSGFDDLDIDIKLKGKTDPQTTIYAIVYGVAGTQNDVDIRLWDRYFYINNEKIIFDVPIDMGNHSITSVNKITTRDLDVNNQIDMKSKKIVNLADGTADGDAVNKALLDKAESQLMELITNLTNKVIQNETAIATMNTNYGYYYFTNKLKHDNDTQVEFEHSINSYPFQTPTLNLNYNYLRINLSGYYHIIYTDFYKGSGKSIIKTSSPTGQIISIDKIEISGSMNIPIGHP